MNRTEIERTAERGFTLIELLIVIVIIGILAAVAIPQFNDTKQSAYDAKAKSDLRNLMSHQELHFYEYGQYASDLSATGSSDSSTVVFSGSDELSVGQHLDIISGGGSGSPLEYTAQTKHPSSDNCWEISVGRGGGGGDEHQIHVASSCEIGGS